MVKFDVVLWQRRMRAVGRVSVEFIASGNTIHSHLPWYVTYTSRTDVVYHLL